MVGWSFAVLCMFGLMALILYETNRPSRKPTGAQLPSNVRVRALVLRAKDVYADVMQAKRSGTAITRAMRDSVVEVSASVATCMLLCGQNDPHERELKDLASNFRDLLADL